MMKLEFSAGGIVYKYQRSKIKSQKGGLLILVAQHSQHHGWVFPKGLIDDHPTTGVKETKEEAALREVKEETGVEGKILKPLSPVTYWYVWPREAGSRSAGEKDPSASSGQEKINKTVYYFLMEYVSGDITKHDMEMENVEWIQVDEVEKRLTFKADKKVWKEAGRLIADGK